MIFQDAIKAHAQWKLRLELYLSGHSNEQLDPENIGRDNLCALGAWIHDPKTKIDATDEFLELKRTHARFHRAVAAIVRDAQSGHPNPHALEPRSEYAQLSLSIISKLNDVWVSNRQTF